MDFDWADQRSIKLLPLRYLSNYAVYVSAVLKTFIHRVMNGDNMTDFLSLRDDLRNTKMAMCYFQQMMLNVITLPVDVSVPKNLKVFDVLSKGCLPVAGQSSWVKPVDMGCEDTSIRVTSQWRFLILFGNKIKRWSIQPGWNRNHIQNDIYFMATFLLMLFNKPYWYYRKNMKLNWFRMENG